MQHGWHLPSITYKEPACDYANFSIIKKISFTMNEILQLKKYEISLEKANASDWNYFFINYCILLVKDIVCKILGD